MLTTDIPCDGSSDAQSSPRLTGSSRRCDVSVAVEQDVLELDVAVDDVVLVELLDCRDDLADVDPHLVLREFLPLVQVREQLAPVHVICFEVMIIV